MYGQLHGRWIFSVASTVRPTPEHEKVMYGYAVRTKPLGGGRCAWVKRGSRRGNVGVTEGGFCDPTTSTHAGGTPATQLYHRHDSRLHPGRGAVRPLLP